MDWRLHWGVPRPNSLDASAPRAILRSASELVTWIALFGMVLVVLASEAWGSRLAPALVLLMAAGLLASRSYPRFGRAFALASVMITAIALGVWGEPAYLATPAVAMGLMSFVPLALIAASWGTKPAAASVGVLAVAMLWTWSSGGVVVGLYLVVVAAGFGLSLRRRLSRADTLHRMLTELALVDPVTGLGNLRSLRRDLERYRAIAEREKQPLLLSRWRPNVPSGLTWDDHDEVARFAQVLDTCMRQADSLYYLGHSEFVGLHLQLESADVPAGRVLERRPNTHVTWTLVENDDLESALASVRMPTRTPAEEVDASIGLN